MAAGSNRSVGPASQGVFPGWEDPRWRGRLRTRLGTWYDKTARELPWRRSRNPYYVWVSEIMLQQTQVATVIPYFERFIQQFPTIAALASAREEQVLRLWEGLGYYRRARQLHRAAITIVAEHAGRFPDDPDAVQRLPGIGRYTSGAILSIAFDQRQPVLEANTLRLLSRLLAYQGDPRGSAGQRILWQAAERLLPRHRTGRFNQALMELGSLVCTPRQPRCDQCPLQSLCPTFVGGLQAQIPRASKRVEFQDVHEAAIVIWQGDSVWLRRCADGERWAGLWDFPRFPWPNTDSDKSSTAKAHTILRRQAQQQSQVGLGPLRPWTELKHGVTRFRIRLSVFQTNTRPPRLRARKKTDTTAPLPTGDGQWIPMRQLQEIPLSTTGRKIARLVVQHLDP